MHLASLGKSQKITELIKPKEKSNRPKKTDTKTILSISLHGPHTHKLNLTTLSEKPVICVNKLFSLLPSEKNNKTILRFKCSFSRHIIIIFNDHGICYYSEATAGIKEHFSLSWTVWGGGTLHHKMLWCVMLCKCYGLKLNMDISLQSNEFTSSHSSDCKFVQTNAGKWQLERHFNAVCCRKHWSANLALFKIATSSVVSCTSSSSNCSFL